MMVLKTRKSTKLWTRVKINDLQIYNDLSIDSCVTIYLRTWRNRRGQLWIVQLKRVLCYFMHVRKPKSQARELCLLLTWKFCWHCSWNCCSFPGLSSEYEFLKFWSQIWTKLGRFTRQRWIQRRCYTSKMRRRQRAKSLDRNVRRWNGNFIRWNWSWHKPVPHSAQ